ncbi:hypothetical protein F8M41_019194 [Gigaspora margarita]|uniref:Uncharacterized protein n=1 Tax=Gigaspora margarita TaxID=4874 RepID=A0A8H4AK89_GIGMA|nr:hypothetical protein F8M41_019194 [Gigaspora margarita]
MESILNNVSYSETLNIKILNALDSIIESSLPPNYKYFVDSFKSIPLHVMSFRPVSDKTKNAFCKLFDAGHTPSSVYHTYWEQQQLKYENDKKMLADRAVFPHKSDIKYLHKKYREKHIGAPMEKKYLTG